MSEARRIRLSRIIKKVAIYILLYLGTFLIIASTFVFSSSERNDFPLLRLIIIIFASVLLTKYFLYMLLSPWHEVAETLKYGKLIKSFYPKVSVLIPAWNEEVGLLATVKSVLKSSYKNVEVVVVNDGSVDKSDEIMKNFSSEYYGIRTIGDPIIIYRYQKNGGKGRALNKAIQLSNGEILISLDADCLVDKYAIANFVKVFQDPKVAAAVGNVKIGNTQTILGTIQYLEFLFSFYFKRADSLLNTIYIIGGAAGAFRREVFERLGDYNVTNITEDIELSMRIQDAGLKIVYAHNAIVFTEGASTLGGLMKQRLRWKRGRFQTFFQYKKMFFSLRKRHRKQLTWVVLPLAIFGEVQLLAEIFFLGFLYVYSFLTRDFTSFLSGILVVGSMFLVQMLFDDKSTRKLSFLVLAPIAWMLFYMATIVEYQALLKSVWVLLRKKEVRWQQWQRSGVCDTIES